MTYLLRTKNLCTEKKSAVHVDNFWSKHTYDFLVKRERLICDTTFSNSRALISSKLKIENPYDYLVQLE